MDEYLNELIAYVVIGVVGVFLIVMAAMALRRQLRIRRSRRRHFRSAARLPDRPGMVVLPAQPATTRTAQREPAEVVESQALDFFSAFEDRLAQIRAEIDALETTPVS